MRREGVRNGRARRPRPAGQHGSSPGQNHPPDPEPICSPPPLPSASQLDAASFCTYSILDTDRTACYIVRPPWGGWFVLESTQVETRSTGLGLVGGGQGGL